MANTTEIYQGQTINYNNELWVVIEKQFAAMGKGGSFSRTRLKNVLSGKVIPVTFKNGDTVDEVTVEKFSVQYLYADNENAYFMNPSNFEQFDFPLDSIAGGTDFLHNNASYIASRYNDKIIAVAVPIKINLQVTEAGDGAKGDTVNNATKEVTLETGAKIHVPLFIKTGDQIQINTELRSYTSKA